MLKFDEDSIKQITYVFVKTEDIQELSSYTLEETQNFVLTTLVRKLKVLSPSLFLYHSQKVYKMPVHIIIS